MSTAPSGDDGKSRTDHLVLEEYFATLAKKNTAEAEDHAAMARAYRAGVRKGAMTGSPMATTC